MATRGANDQGSEALMTGSVGSLRCGVCLELYRQPKLLPCFHTFCTQCLKRLAASHKGDTTLRGTSHAFKARASTESPNTESAGKDNSSFSCPTCREVVFPPPGGVEVFQRNFKMEGALACAQLQPLACEMCDNSSPSVIACVECQKRLCALCQRFHDQVAGTKYHNLISLETSGHQVTGGKDDGRQATGLHTPKGVKTKDTVFFKRRSSGQEILQNTVPRYVGDVRSGQAEDAAKTTAFTVQLGQQFVAFCVDLNGEGFSVLALSAIRANYAGCNQGVHWSQHPHNLLRKYTLKGAITGNFAFSGCLPELLMQPWPEGWLIISQSLKQLQLINGTGQYRNEDTGQLTGASVGFVGVLSNSSTNGHVYAIHNGGSGCVWEIQQMSLDPKGNISVKPFFQVLLQDTLNQFDVSADEEYFATMKSWNVIFEVNVYRRLEAQPCASFTTGCGETNTGHINERACLCFSRYKGQTMLRLSVLGQNCVYVLDHTKGCAVVHQMKIDRPVFLRRDCRERVWMGLQNKSIVVFET